MNIKISGGGDGKYANSGSCISVINYLKHEDNIKKINFFNRENDNVNIAEIIRKIDNNKAKLSKKDAKFFVITVSPSEKEIKAMGDTEEERIKNFKKYINEKVMENYAVNFNKNLTAKDILYYAKIHTKRGEKEGEQMHAHIIVSRKDKENKIKLSPKTNHRNTEKGNIKGGFNRDLFFSICEKDFDNSFDYKRDLKESYKYANAKKNGNFETFKKAIKDGDISRNNLYNINSSYMKEIISIYLRKGKDEVNYNNRRLNEKELNYYNRLFNENKIEDIYKLQKEGKIRLFTYKGVLFCVDREHRNIVELDKININKNILQELKREGNEFVKSLSVEEDIKFKEQMKKDYKQKDNNMREKEGEIKDNYRNEQKEEYKFVFTENSFNLATIGEVAMNLFGSYGDAKNQEGVKKKKEKKFYKKY